MTYKILLVILIGFVLRWLGKKVVVRSINQSTSDENLRTKPGYHTGVISVIVGDWIVIAGVTLLFASLISNIL